MVYRLQILSLGQTLFETLNFNPELFILLYRSPLKEKQNLTASVQRSKSAQTPSRQKHMENRLNGGGRVGSPYGARGSPRINQVSHAASFPKVYVTSNKM